MKELHGFQTRKTDPVFLWEFDGIRKWDAVQPIPDSFQSRGFRLLLEALLPGLIGLGEGPLNRMTWNSHFGTVALGQVLEVKRGMIDSVLGVQFYLSDGPVVGPRQMP